MQPVYSIRVDSEDHSFLAGGFINHNTECRMDQLAAVLLDGIDEDTVEFEDNYDGTEQQPSVLPARFSEPVGQRLAGYRRRDGNEHASLQPP